MVSVENVNGKLRQPHLSQQPVKIHFRTALDEPTAGIVAFNLYVGRWECVYLVSLTLSMYRENPASEGSSPGPSDTCNVSTRPIFKGARVSLPVK